MHGDSSSKRYVFLCKIWGETTLELLFRYNSLTSTYILQKCFGTLRTNTYCALALSLSNAEVRSFGTEDRPTDRPAPPREEIYEYIIFRGSDIKDITVCEPPKAQHTLPQDPAIVQVSTFILKRWQKALRKCCQLKT